MSANHHSNYTCSYMLVNYHCIYIRFSVFQQITSFNKLTSHSLIIVSIHSSHSQPRRKSTKQYISQPLLRVNIQFSVNYQTIQQRLVSAKHHCLFAFSLMSVNHHCIYTFSVQSTNKPFNKSI